MFFLCSVHVCVCICLCASDTLNAHTQQRVFLSTHTHTHMYVPEALKTAANAGLCILNLLPYIAEHIDYTQGIVFICMTLGVRKV